MTILIAALLMVFYVTGFMSALLVIKVFKKYVEKEDVIVPEETKTSSVNDITKDIMSEWLYGELSGTGGANNE